MTQQPVAPEIVQAVAAAIRQTGRRGSTITYEDAARAAIKAVRDHLAQDGLSAIVACGSRSPTKRQGERDTEFVKRLAVGMLDAAAGHRGDG